ncbi:hypothetical protein PLESTF_001331300 [Pleodorina starrii]|nr:hypothetical protein PLESTF_001331300 [Pleodorina starrii]
MAILPTKTPEPRTTGRRGRKAAVQPPEQTSQEAAPKQLHFPGEAAAEQPQTNEQPVAATENSDPDGSAAPSPDQVASDGAQEAIQLASAEAHAETHDNPSVLMASPIILTAREHQFSTNVVALHMSFDQAAAAAEGAATPAQAPPAEAHSAPALDEAQNAPVPFEFDQAAAVAAPQPLALDAPQPAVGSPLSIAADSPMLSPLPLASSPLPSLASPQMMAASPLQAAVGPAPMEASPLPAALSPLPALSPMDASPIGHLNQGAVAPSPLPAGAAVEGSPLATITPLSFTSDAPRNGAAAFAQPLPASIPASPLSLTEEAIEQAVFSPMPEDGLVSPISLSGAVDLTPQPPLQPQLSEEDLQLAQEDGDEMMADATPLAAEPTGPGGSSPLTFASDRRAATPATAPSPAPAFVGAPPDSAPHASASPMPVVSSFQGFAAVFPTPAGSELEPDSPSLAGLLSTAATAPSPSPAALMSASAAVNAPSPSNIAAAFVDQPPNGACTASAPSTAAHTTPTVGVDADGMGDVASAPCTTLATPMEGAGLPPAPAPTPECAVAPGWSLAQTPLANALAMSLTANAEARCEDADTALDAEDEQVEAAEEAEACQSEQLPLGSPVEDMEMEDQEPQQATEPVAPSPAPQPTPVAATAKTPSQPARSPAVGPLFRNAATPKGSAKAATPSTAAASVPRTGGSYVNVESRYNKTPTMGATAAKPRPSFAASGTVAAAASTPVAPTNAAPGVKSVKRVSINTPEGPRSAAPLRQVVPTPFRPKSAQPNPPAEQAPAAELQQQLPAEEEVQQPMNQQSAAAAEERRAKAAERLKAIHATEQTAPAARSSGPGYLATTQAFAVKSSAKAMKSKVDTGSYDPRSLRQLKREVKEAVAKKEAKVALNEARSAKLTPKVAERQLPMPDDEEMSDDQAEYNEGQENDLVAAMSGLEVAPPKNNAPVPLRGLPAPQGRHLRFNEKGSASESPQRTVLRGLPVATGKYKRFE